MNFCKGLYIKKYIPPASLEYWLLLKTVFRIRIILMRIRIRGSTSGMMDPDPT